MTEPKLLRGSRKHIIDWVRSPDFRDELNAMIRPSGVMVAPDDAFMPTGANGDQGIQEARLETFLSDPAMRRDLQRWWLAAPRGANTPNWDLAAHATLKGKPALVLVEAKANERELSEAGKAKPTGKNPPGTPRGTPKPPPSEDSKRNHAHIGAALSSVSASLGGKERGFNLSRDSHYQFANRIAFSWKLALMGMPTVLVYLGFTGDRGIEDAGPMLRDAAHWEKLMRDHVEGMVPQTLIGQWQAVGDAGFYPMIASMPRREDSPPRPHRR
jgi:hypothetical protein